jgi:hypothetical protein
MPSDTDPPQREQYAGDKRRYRYGDLRQSSQRYYLQNFPEYISAIATTRKVAPAANIGRFRYRSSVPDFMFSRWVVVQEVRIGQPQWLVVDEELDGLTVGHAKYGLA